MQGNFSSSQPLTFAITAIATNGASGIQATSDTATGVIGASSNGGIGIVAESVQGTSISPGIGIRASSDNGSGVSASSTNGEGVRASSEGGIGVHSSSENNYGIFGECSGYSFGVVGKAPNAGVAAFNPNNDHAAYLASDCCAAWFTGNVQVTGSLFKGGGGFQIDHPLHPGAKYLSHSFVESSEMKNVYDGVVIADAKGEAVVQLPDWFEAVNEDCRYQLTPIGGGAPELHISQEINHNRFWIAGSKPGMRVSWQVTGVRRDAWAQANRIVVEKEKPTIEQGRYLHPQVRGIPMTDSIAEIRHPRTPRAITSS